MKKKLILISGKMQSGKNQFAEYLHQAFSNKSNYKITEDLFARTLKDWCKEDFSKLSAVLENLAEQIKSSISLYNDTREHMMNPNIIDSIEKTIDKLKIQDHNWYEDKTEITRVILQLYGTDIFRKRVSDSWWVDKMMQRVLQSDSDIIVITDTRFPNEISGMYNNSFETITIRIQRNINTQERGASHTSETSLDDWKEWNYVVENNGSLEDLEASAKTIVAEITKTNIEETLGLFTRQSKENIQWVNSLTS